jgi:hypothetical protein
MKEFLTHEALQKIIIRSLRLFPALRARWLFGHLKIIEDFLNFDGVLAALDLIIGGN